MKMLKVVMIVPLRYNDGTEVLAEHFCDLELEIVQRWGGFTKWPVEGAWLNEEQFYQDESVAYVVSMGTSYGPARVWWQRRAAMVARVWQQQSVYLEFSEVEVEFVAPTEERK